MTFEKGLPVIILHTNFGDISIKLDTEQVPVTAQNFLNYAKRGFYDGTIFHRVIEGFMIQGGGFLPGMEDKESDEPIANEADKARSNTRGTLAMARTSDPHSASNQFFINVSDNTFLDFKHNNSNDGWGYCVFGEVVEGMNVVDDIIAIKTGSRKGHQDVPITDVIIEDVEIVE